MKGEFESKIQKMQDLNSLFLHQLEISNRKKKNSKNKTLN